MVPAGRPTGVPAGGALSMAVHDWTRVDAGTFHAFHTAWVTHLSEALNGGVLPPGYYAMPEQHLGRSVADVLALHAGTPAAPTPAAQLPGEGQAVAVAPPRVRQRITLSASTRARRRTLTVRHVSGHRVVALIEIVSPANKDRPAHVEDLAGKVVQALAAGVHVLLADLLPRGPHDPDGIHGAVCDLLDPEARPFDAEGSLGPLTVASYVAGLEIDAYLEQFGPGDDLPDMPLFLESQRYVQVPLGATYLAAFRGLPAHWRDVLAAAADR
jgi:hypothetical protein